MTIGFHLCIRTVNHIFFCKPYFRSLNNKIINDVFLTLMHFFIITIFIVYQIYSFSVYSNLLCLYIFGQSYAILILQSVSVRFYVTLLIQVRVNTCACKNFKTLCMQMHPFLVRNLLFRSCRFLIWCISSSRLSVFYVDETVDFPFIWFEQRLRVEGRKLLFTFKTL